LWLVLTLMLVCLVGAAEVMLLFTRRFLLPRLGGGHHEELGPVTVHSMMVFYGLVAALIAVNAYEKYSEVSRVVNREATSIAALYRQTTGYPEPTRGRVQTAIHNYVDQVITMAWPQQKLGQVPTAGVAHMDALQTLLFSFEPSTEGQKIVHSQTLSAYNELVVARRLRVAANKEHLPGVMWKLLTLGAMVCLFSACLFRVENRGIHSLSIGLLGTLTVLVLFMIFLWDRPYMSQIGITPEPYELIREQLMRP
jgi:hypothetical protein